MNIDHNDGFNEAIDDAIYGGYIERKVTWQPRHDQGFHLISNSRAVPYYEVYIRSIYGRKSGVRWYDESEQRTIESAVFPIIVVRIEHDDYNWGATNLHFVQREHITCEHCGHESINWPQWVDGAKPDYK